MSIETNAWPLVNLGEICTAAFDGPFGSKLKSDDYADEGIRVVRLENIGHLQFIEEKKTYVTTEKYESLKSNTLRSKDILFSSFVDEEVRVCLLPESNETFINKADCFCLRVDRELTTPEFLNYFLSSRHTYDRVKRQVHGATRPRINLGTLKSFELSLPPLAEQKQIAAKLDELLAQVDTIKARLDAIPKIIKRFRQSVLAAAVSGRLTEEWREVNRVSGDSWEEITLSKIVKKIEAGKSLKCIETPPLENQYGIIKISAVTWGVFDEEQSKTLTDKSLFMEDRRVIVGDFLISRANTIELLGNPVIVHAVSKNLMLSDKVLRLVMQESDKPWLNIFLRSNLGRKEIESRSTGNQLSMRNIGQKDLLEIPISQPTEPEKTEIVRRVEQLFAFADQIETRVKDAQARVNHLTQSILAKAFRGELTADWRAQNPDLISGENSAEALLARIRAERERQVRGGRKGRKPAKA